jgi:hypothetical protein
MGHIDVKGLKNTTTGIPIDSVCIKNCRVCALANIKRQKFPKRSLTRADDILFRIHIDICGPLPLGYGQIRYFIPFIDDKSRLTTVEFLKTKDEAVHKFHEFRTAAENFTKRKVAVVRVDNAGELVSGEFEKYCKRHGIAYEKSVPDASQQNGVAERMIQTTERMTRAMLVDAGLPHFFWPLAAQAAVHIKNRVPHSSLPPDTTPFELWFNKKPDLSHLRPFGALVVCRKTNSDDLNKVTERGEDGVFMGYARDAKGYLVWFPSAKAIRTRRDIVFHGFPTPKDAPPLSQILWDEIPYDLEPRFRDFRDAKVIFSNGDRITDPPGQSSSVRGIGDTGCGQPSMDPCSVPPKDDHILSGRLPQGCGAPNVDSPAPSELPNPAVQPTIPLNNSTPPRRSSRLAKVTANMLLVDHANSVEGGNMLSALLNSEIDELEVDCEEADLAQLVVAFVEAEATYVGAALTTPIDDPNAKDPRTIQEAESSVYWTHWLAAILEELESLRAKGVYVEVPELPPGRKAVDSKWVLHIKRDRNGCISRFKARLVAKGFTQIPGQDFTYTFAPVARWESIRILLTIAASLDMEIRQVDVKTAFLNGPLDEEIYMRMPRIVGKGFWKLLKGLYGLKQAGRQWYLELNSKLESIGFKRTESDWSLYVRHSGSSFTMLTTSVDDMLIASTSTAESDLVIKQLGDMFDITDTKEPQFHLGCGLTRNRNNHCIRLDQQSYAESILRDFGFDNSKPVSTPMEPNTRLFPFRSTPSMEEAETIKKFPYTAIVGKLMYLATCTRPDIAYAVRELARFMTNYGPPHIAAAKHLLRYLKGTVTYGISLGNNDRLYPAFRALTDSDWGMGDERKSISGYLITLGKSPLSWSSKQQAVIALSSCEAEYLASTHCAREVLWFRNIFAELGFPQVDPTTIFCDNQGTVACTHDPHAHSRMKHISIREHFIRDCVMKRLVNVVYVSNQENTADLFTKPLGRILHSRWVEMLGLGVGQGGVSECDRATKLKA